MIDNKSDVLSALRSIYPLPNDLIKELTEAADPAIIDAIVKTWMRRTEVQWKDKHENGADIWNALHPHQEGNAVGANILLHELFESRYIYNGKSTSQSKRSKFKPFLARDYLGIDPRHLKHLTELKCQVLGVILPKSLVIGGHIFKHEWGGVDAEVLLGIKNIDSSRNGLLLFCPIEKAFDRSELCFLKSEKDDSFYLKLLNPNIREVTLLDACKKFINPKAVDIALVLATLEDRLTQDGRLLTFGDIEGRTLICEKRTRPYKRCLNFHASRARTFALSRGWIKEDVVFQYSWSQHFDSVALASFLDGLGPSFDDLTVEDELSFQNEFVDTITPGDAVDRFLSENISDDNLSDAESQVS